MKSGEFIKEGAWKSEEEKEQVGAVSGSGHACECVHFACVRLYN